MDDHPFDPDNLRAFATLAIQSLEHVRHAARQVRAISPELRRDLKRLLRLRATTPEGKVAKAAAIMAMNEAGLYCDIRDDSVELMDSLLRDVAGFDSHCLGDDAAGAISPANGSEPGV